MKTVALAFALAATFAAGAASAAERISDVAYLKANRCRGLAAGIEGVVNAEALNSFVKDQRLARAPYIMDRADAEFDRARREAKSDSRKERLTAELTSSCQPYLGGATNVAKQ